MNNNENILNCSFNLSKVQKKWLANAAQKSGCGMSEFLRRMIEKKRDPDSYRAYMKEVKISMKQKLNDKKASAKKSKKKVIRRKKRN